MSNDPITFEKRGGAYIGQAAAISFTFGEVIIFAPNIDELELAFLQFTGHMMDVKLTKESALMPVDRLERFMEEKI